MVIRRDFLLGFHNRKQQKKVEYLTKKALKEKKERALEKIAVIANGILYCRNDVICSDEKRN